MTSRVPEMPAQPLDPELLALLGELRSAQRSPSRSSAGRAGVMAAAALSREAAVSDRWTRWRRRGVLAGLSLAGANLAVGGLVALAAGAQPDSMLYGVKRAAEAAKLALTLDPQEHARLELDLADRRAGEAEAMAHSGHATLALDAARDATTLVEQASATLAGFPGAENQQALQHASTEARTRLEQVFTALENGSDPGAADAARSLDAQWSNGVGAGGHASQGPPSTVPGGAESGNSGKAGSSGAPGSPSGAPTPVGSAGSSGGGGAGDHGGHGPRPTPGR